MAQWIRYTVMSMSCTGWTVTRRSAVARRCLLFVTVLLSFLGRATPASAHGGIDQAGFSNYATAVSSVSPAGSGIVVTAFGVSGGIKLVNNSGREVMVLGYNNEPYLRIDTTGTFVNLNSPATYVNKRLDANVPVPEKATSSDVPDWFQLSYGNTVWWHDHRTHWMGATPPDAVQVAPQQEQLVYPAWKIPIVVGGQPGAITGTLTWLPPPKRTSWLLISLGMFAAAVLLLQFFRSVKSFAGLAALGALIANVIVAVSRASVERAESGQRVACFATTAVALVLFFLGLVSKHRGRTPIAWGLAGGVLAGTGIAYLKAFSFASIDGSADPLRVRWAIAVEIGLGVALAATALVGFVERRMSRKSRVPGRFLVENPPEIDPEPSAN